MRAEVSPVSSSADRRLPQKAAPAQAPATGGKVVPAQDSSDFRLVIEKDEAAGCYVYKTVDRLTGNVVQQFPIEQILRLRQSTTYEAGAVITAKA